MLIDIVVLIFCYGVILFIVWVFAYGSWCAFREPYIGLIKVTEKRYADGHVEYWPWVLYKGRWLWGRREWSEKVGVAANIDRKTGSPTHAWVTGDESGSYFDTEFQARAAAKMALELEEQKRLANTLTEEKEL